MTLFNSEQEDAAELTPAEMARAARKALRDEARQRRQQLLALLCRIACCGGLWVCLVRGMRAVVRTLVSPSTYLPGAALWAVKYMYRLHRRPFLRCMWYISYTAVYLGAMPIMMSYLFNTVCTRRPTRRQPPPRAPSAAAATAVARISSPPSVRPPPTGRLHRQRAPCKPPPACHRNRPASLPPRPQLLRAARSPPRVLNPWSWCRRRSPARTAAITAWSTSPSSRASSCLASSRSSKSSTCSRFPRWMGPASSRHSSAT